MNKSLGIHNTELLKPCTYKQGCSSEFALKSKYRRFRCLKQSRGMPWMLTIEAWRLKMEPWRIYRPVVTDSHQFDEEQDPYLH
jgi:hypothetical protein